jgi:hypothetical protein
MLPGQPGEPAGDGAAPQSDATDPGVLEAQEIVGRAWGDLLFERLGQAESELATAVACCDAAYRQLAAAQRAGDPEAIGSAHAVLEKALQLTRECSIACDQALQAAHGADSTPSGTAHIPRHPHHDQK